MKRLLFITAVIALSIITIECSSKEKSKPPSTIVRMANEARNFMKFDDILPVGSPAPEFTLKTIEGEELSLSSLRGKVVVIEFGART